MEYNTHSLNANTLKIITSEYSLFTKEQTTPMSEILWRKNSHYSKMNNGNIDHDNENSQDNSQDNGMNLHVRRIISGDNEGFDSKYKSSHCYYFGHGYCKDDSKCKFYHQGIDNYNDLKSAGYDPPDDIPNFNHRLTNDDTSPAWVTVVNKNRTRNSTLPKKCNRTGNNGYMSSNHTNLRKEIDEQKSPHLTFLDVQKREVAILTPSTMIPNNQITTDVARMTLCQTGNEDDVQHEYIMAENIYWCVFRGCECHPHYWPDTMAAEIEYQYQKSLLKPIYLHPIKGLKFDYKNMTVTHDMDNQIGENYRIRREMCQVKIRNPLYLPPIAKEFKDLTHIQLGSPDVQISFISLDSMHWDYRLVAADFLETNSAHILSIEKIQYPPQAKFYELRKSLLIQKNETTGFLKKVFSGEDYHLQIQNLLLECSHGTQDHLSFTKKIYLPEDADYISVIGKKEHVVLYGKFLLGKSTEESLTSPLWPADVDSHYTTILINTQHDLLEHSSYMYTIRDYTQMYIGYIVRYTATIDPNSLHSNQTTPIKLRTRTISKLSNSPSHSPLSQNHQISRNTTPNYPDSPLITSYNPTHSVNSLYNLDDNTSSNLPHVSTPQIVPRQITLPLPSPIRPSRNLADRSEESKCRKSSQ